MAGTRGRFQLGQSGNPKGRTPGVPNKATLEIRAWARSVVDDPAVRDRVFALARQGKLQPAMLIELFNRAYGKVRDESRVQVLGDDELVRRLQAARARCAASECVEASRQSGAE